MSIHDSCTISQTQNIYKIKKNCLEPGSTMIMINGGYEFDLSLTTFSSF